MGVSVAPGTEPKYESLVYGSWLKGMISSVSPEDTPQDAGRDVWDFLIDRDNSLKRAPGIVEAEDVSPRLLTWLFEQASLDYVTELVAIDAPYLGYKGTSDFVFVNAGIDAPGVYGWNAVNILGTLLFSDGSNSTYTRESLAATVTDISAEVIARTFANAFGRTFAGAYTDAIDGLQGLGIKWNATTGDPADWSGAGSGSELLISNSLEADKVVALRPIGFDALGILCRKSLWIGYPTGVANRPADFRSRVNGIGCVAEPTATISPAGVSFLSDEGVCNFNQNEFKIISEEINSELLPIDYTQLDRYQMKYMPVRQMLLLQTPVCTWIYEFPRAGLHSGRWTRRSFALDNIVVFTDQSGNIFWNDVIGTWEDQVLTWNEMIASQVDAAPQLFFSSDSVLGREDPLEEEYLGEAMVAEWETPQNVKVEITQQVSTIGFEIEYISTAESVVEIETPDSNGDFGPSVTKTLPSTAGVRRRKMIWYATTGMGAKLRVHYVSGRPAIYRVRQIIMPSGPVIGSVP